MGIVFSIKLLYVQIYHMQVIIAHYFLCENSTHVRNSLVAISPAVIREKEDEGGDYVTAEGARFLSLDGLEDSVFPCLVVMAAPSQDVRGVPLPLRWPIVVFPARCPTRGEWCVRSSHQYCPQGRIAPAGASGIHTDDPGKESQRREDGALVNIRSSRVPRGRRQQRVQRCMTLSWDRSLHTLADAHRHTYACVARLTVLLAAREGEGRDAVYLAVIHHSLYATREHLDLLTHALSLRA